MPKKKIKYDKELIEQQCLRSKEIGRITEPLGVFILARCNDIAGAYFETEGSKELHQALVDEAVLRICEKFLYYYREGGSGANLIISMAISTMLNKIKSLAWADLYGEKQKSYVDYFEDGTWVRKLEKLKRDDNIGQLL
tara:strand:+ start:2233 stop:2649 length:417 start_codon:yes stop_codon:yes gene_type:complete